MKLAQKLFLLFSISTLIGTIAIGVVSFIFTRNAVQTSISNQQLQLARQTMDKIDRLLNERYNDIQTIAGDTAIEQFLDTQSTTATTDAIPSLIKKRLDELSIVTGPWDDISIITTQGNILYALDKSSIGQKITDTSNEYAIYQNALKGNITSSDAFFDDELHKPTILFATPIESASNPSHPVVGIVIAHLSWPIVTEIIQSIPNATVDLYNSKGVEIANNDNPDDVFKINNSTKTIIKNALDGIESSHVTKNVDNTQETVSSIATEKGFLTYKGNKWVLLIEQPTKIAFAPAAQTSIVSVGILTPLLIMINASLLLILLHLLKPIEELTQVTQEIASGNLSKRATVHSTDEIGQLASSFNAMASTIQQTNAGLQEKVQEKTQQFEQKLTEMQRINKTMIDRELKMIELKNKIVELEKSHGISSQREEVNI